METIIEALDLLFGEGFIESLLPAFILLAVLVVLYVIFSIWSFIVKFKIQRVMLKISEFPDQAHCEEFLSAINHISVIGKMLAKMGKSYMGMSKGECRQIFNSTILNSKKLSFVDKSQIRAAMISIGCDGLINDMSNY